MVVHYTIFSIFSILNISIIKNSSTLKRSFWKEREVFAFDLSTYLLHFIFACLFLRSVSHAHAHTCFRSDVFFNQNELPRQPRPDEECSGILWQILMMGSHILSQENHRPFPFRAFIPL